MQGGISSVFNANLWRCTGYVPKKFGFQYREFPCWEEFKDGDSQPNVSQGADALFALSKEAEAAVALPQGTVRKVFKLEDAAFNVGKKDIHRIRPAGDHSGKKRKDGCREMKDHSAKKKSSWDNKKRGSCVFSFFFKYCLVEKFWLEIVQNGSDILLEIIISMFWFLFNKIYFSCNWVWCYCVSDAYGSLPNQCVFGPFLVCFCMCLTGF
jgi:hypothetical protein